MIELPTEKKWGGDGWGQDPRLLLQVKRTPKTALYRVTSFKTGTTTGYEVFRIGVIPKGTVIFDTVTEDDKERYPTAEDFGFSAWNTASLGEAEDIFDHLEKGEDAHGNTPKFKVVKTDSGEPTPEPVKRQHYVGIGLSIPSGEFSVDELATSNKVHYAKAYLFVRDGQTNGTIKFVKKEHRNGSRKPTKIFAKSA
jgi:hypothetical protein